jgi:hypothetical protein
MVKQSDNCITDLILILYLQNSSRTSNFVDNFFSLFEDILPGDSALINNYLMRLSMTWRIIKTNVCAETEADNTNRGLAKSSYQHYHVETVS